MKYEVTPAALRGHSRGSVSIAKTPRTIHLTPSPRQSRTALISKRGRQERTTKFSLPGWLALAQIRKSGFKYISTVSLTACAPGCWNHRFKVMISDTDLQLRLHLITAHSGLLGREGNAVDASTLSSFSPRRRRVGRWEREAVGNTSCSAGCQPWEDEDRRRRQQRSC